MGALLNGRYAPISWDATWIANRVIPAQVYRARQQPVSCLRCCDYRADGVYWVRITRCI